MLLIFILTVCPAWRPFASGDGKTCYAHDPKEGDQLVQGLLHEHDVHPCLGITCVDNPILTMGMLTFIIALQSYFSFFFLQENSTCPEEYPHNVHRGRYCCGYYKPNASVPICTGTELTADHSKRCCQTRTELCMGRSCSDHPLADSIRSFS